MRKGIVYLFLVLFFLSILFFLLFFLWSSKNSEIGTFEDTGSKDFISYITKSLFQKNESQQSTNIDKKNAKVNVDFSTDSGREIYNSTYIKRGTFISLSGNTLSLSNDSTGESYVEIDISDIDLVDCWPETVSNPDGSSTFLRKAYIPFVPNAPLSWPNSTRRQLSIVSDFLDRSSYLIIKIESLEEVGLPSKAEQVVVLGC